MGGPFFYRGLKGCIGVRVQRFLRGWWDRPGRSSVKLDDHHNV